MNKKIALKKITLRKLSTTTLENVRGGRAADENTVTGMECGGVYYCNSAATCSGTACNVSVR